MSFKKEALVVMLIALFIQINVQAEGVTETEVYEGVTEVTETEVGTEEIETEEETEETDLLSDYTWSDFIFSVGESVYKLPTPVSEVLKEGWVLEEAYAGSLIDPFTYIEAQAKNEKGYLANFYISNSSDVGVVTEDCMVVGVDLNLDAEEAGLPEGLSLGLSDVNDIKNAYGIESTSEKSEDFTTYSYIVGEYERVDLRVSNDDEEVLVGFAVKNFVISDEVAIEGANSEATETVLGYEKPASLSGDISDIQVKIDNNVYSLPVPVKVLLDDGWEVDEDNSAKASTAHGSVWVRLLKDDAEINTVAYNIEDDAEVLSNLWIQSIDMGVGGTEFEVPGGIRVGMTKEDLTSILEESGIDCKEYSVGDFDYLEYNTEGNETYTIVSIYNGNNDSNKEYEKGTVVYVSTSNR